MWSGNELIMKGETKDSPSSSKVGMCVHMPEQSRCQSPSLLYFRIPLLSARFSHAVGKVWMERLYLPEKEAFACYSS